MRRSSEFALALAVMREEIAGSDLLPGAYARYRPLLADGLRFFLERLSAARLRRVLAEQADLPACAPIAQRVVALLHHVPALHKLGQVVARDRRLHPGFRRRLQQLESLAPRTPTTEVVRLLEKEFKGWRKAGIELGPEPLAEGSVAVVMPFTWREGHGVAGRPAPLPPRRWSGDQGDRGSAAVVVDYEDQEGDDDEKKAGGSSGPRALPEGVFKVLKPAISDLLEEDLDILGALGSFLDEDCERYHLPRLDYRETLETIRDLLLHEVRLDEEQRHLAEAAKIYSSMRSVIIPGLLPFCSERLTAMERLYGQKITGKILPQGLSRRGLARVIGEALIARPIFSSQPAALFHADPHAGNLFLTAQGRVGILDWSLAGRLRKSDRVALVQLLLGGLTLDAGSMEQAVGELTHKPPAQPGLRDVLDASLRELRWGTLPGVGWLIRLLDELVLRAGVRFETDLLLFRKSLLTLEGVLADLVQADQVEGCALLNEAVLATFLERWMAEWPERFYTPADARSYTTHLSTADVVGLLWSTPARAARWWAGTGADLLRVKTSPAS